MPGTILNQQPRAFALQCSNADNIGMTGSRPDPPLTLAEAENAFSQFLSTNGLPSRIRWITAEQIIVGDDRHHFVSAEGAELGTAEASRRYMEGVTNGLGIVLQAFCATTHETIAAVYVPTDSIDAQHRLIGRGLKLSCPTSPIPASTVENPVEWRHLAENFRTRFDIMRQAYDL
jgi:hypothetical protein